MESGDNTNNETFEVFLNSLNLLLVALKVVGRWEVERIQIMKHSKYFSIQLIYCL